MEAFWIPRAETGFRIERGTTKSLVRIMLALKSMLNPCGENCSPRMLRVEGTSSGHSWIMLKFASVSTRRPGEVPTAAGWDEVRIG